MCVSASRVRVEPDHAAALMEALRPRARLVDASDGVERVDAWQSSADPSEVLMVSQWRDRAGGAT
jgi:quinol monooxygenase YgiN